MATLYRLVDAIGYGRLFSWVALLITSSATHVLTMVRGSCNLQHTSSESPEVVVTNSSVDF